MKIKNISKLLVLFLLIMSAIIVNFNTKIAYADNSSEIVMEVNSARVLYEKNAYSKKYMASTTKILTAICIIENCNLNDKVTITKDTTGVEGSSIYLEPNEILTVKDLLYGLMLRSGNDCAETLAKYCSGTIDNFALLMNTTAKKIGAENSNFTNPHGLHNDNHYTTAYDLALISCYAMKNADFREIVGTKSIRIPFTTRNTVRLLINKNKMLKDFEGCTGIKTGFTKKAGRCLVSSCKRGEMELVCVVLNCPPMFEKSKANLTECFNNFRLYKLVESDNIIGFLPVENQEDKCGVCIKKDIVLPLSESEFSNVAIEYDLPNKIDKPLKKDSLIGYVKIYSKKCLIFDEKIYTIVDVN